MTMETNERVARRWAARRRKRRGIAAVEFALVAPLFILLVLGIIELGRGMMVQQLLTNATREGARQAIIEGVTSYGATAVVQSFLATAGIKNAQITIAPAELSSVGHGSPLTVSASVQYNDVNWLPVPKFLGGMTLSAQAVMRRETPY